MGGDLEYGGRLGHIIFLFLSISSNDFFKQSFFPVSCLFLCFHTFRGEEKKVLCGGASFNEAQNSSVSYLF